MMNRRELLGSVGAASLVPAAWAVVEPDQLQPAFQAALRLGPVQGGAGSRHWAEIVAGKLSGSHLEGTVQSGRMDWEVDPCSGAVEVAMTCSVLRADGVNIELHDRTAHATASDRAELPGHPTAPRLVVSGQTAVSPRQLVGRLDTTAFWRGFVSLRAFESG